MRASDAGSVKKRYMCSLSSNTNAPSTAPIGRVDGAQRGRALDVHVDVAGDDRLDPIGVGAELALPEELDRQADVRGRDLVGDDLRAAGHLRLRVLVAVRELDRDRAPAAEALGRGGGLADAGAMLRRWDCWRRLRRRRTRTWPPSRRGASGIVCVMVSPIAVLLTHVWPCCSMAAAGPARVPEPRPSRCRQPPCGRRCGLAWLTPSLPSSSVCAHRPGHRSPPSAVDPRAHRS